MKADNSKRKCVFLYVNQGFTARYLLRSGVLETLRKNAAEVVILSHNGDEKTFRDAYKSDNVKVEKFKHESSEDYLRNTRLQRILINLRAYVLNGKYDTRTVDDFRKIFLSQNGWGKDGNFKGRLKGFLWETATRMLKNSKILRKALISFESRFFCPVYHADLFNKYAPDLVVVSALCGFQYNEFFAREAHKFGVPVCCIVLSWDNTSGMGMPGYDPDHVIAWTENMKKELIELNDIKENKIFVGGVAHFDSYYENEEILGKEELFQKLGLDCGRKTIFYATKSPKRFPWGPELVADLAKAMEMGKIRYPCQILVRIHPLHYRTVNGRLIFQNILDDYDRVAKMYPFVCLNIPETVSRQMDFDLSHSETILISSILKHSDVMLNMFSTMVIEAAIFDLPSINVCIREKCKADFGRSRQDIMIDYVQTHNQRVVQTCGVKTVFTMDELYDAVDGYLNKPETDAEGRELIVKNEAGPFRGNAGDTIGKHILFLAGYPSQRN